MEYYKLAMALIRNYNSLNQKYPMDTNDVYTYRRILYKCDSSISKIYTNLFKLLSQTANSSDQTLKSEIIKQIDVVIFQIFKYKTALLTLQKDIQDNQQQQVIADQQIQNSKQSIKQLTDNVKSAQLVRKHKLEFNEIAKSVKEFDTINELNNKIKEVEEEVEKLLAKYDEQSQQYAEKQRLFKIAFSALIALKSDDNSGTAQSPLSGM